MKSSVDEIRARFDADVERFSNLETGQTAAMDAPLALELLAEAAARSTPQAKRLLDVGCGAGNYALKLLKRLPNLQATLIDLSRPMLDRAEQRVRAASCDGIATFQGDIRNVELHEHSFDIIVAAAVLHHLRTDAEWEMVFAKVFRSLTPGGSFWIYDLVEGATPELHALVWSQYGEYLRALGGESYRDRVFDYVEKEDTPKPLFYQLALLQRVGFAAVEVLHKRACFAAFGGVKGE